MKFFKIKFFYIRSKCIFYCFFKRKINFHISSKIERIRFTKIIKPQVLVATIRYINIKNEIITKNDGKLNILIWVTQIKIKSLKKKRKLQTLLHRLSDGIDAMTRTQDPLALLIRELDTEYDLKFRSAFGMKARD